MTRGEPGRQAAGDPGTAKPPVGLVGDGASVEGLRHSTGGLVLKIEYAGAVAQFRLRGAARFPEDGGTFIERRFGLRMPRFVRRMIDFWSVAGRPALPNGRGRRAEQTRWTG